ncbi:MAG TPA: diguanylate cyclase, partial [Rubrivivax sp.]|nr:diguanylate cyclase [Rubrivivax sp.]
MKDAAAAACGGASSDEAAWVAWSALLAGMPHAAWVVCLATRRVVAANAAAGAIFGRPGQALVGAAAEAFATSPEDLAWWEAVAAGDVSSLHSDTLVATADGRVLHVSRSIGLLKLPGAGTGDALSHALVMLSDRSSEERVMAERESLLSELQATLEATADGILVTDLGGRPRAFNRRFAEMWDMPLDMLQQHDDAAVQSWMAGSVSDPALYDQRLQALRRATMASGRDRLELNCGRIIERVTRPMLAAGRPQGRVWSFRDLTERIAAEERIESLSRLDSLTGLPNRRQLAERVHEAAARVPAGGGAFALLVVGLDRFRQINESLGHETGDRVLVDVARRIGACLRADDLLARLGGDQFAVLVYPADAAAAEATARRILNVVAQPCSLDGAHFTITCSIGMALGPSQGVSMDDLARHAEAAMRAVKLAGRASFRLHQARAEVDRRLHMRLDHAMRQALV